MFLLLHVGEDVCGLFGMSSSGGPKEGVGNAAHIGGMLGGVLFFALDCLFEAATASSCLRTDDFIDVIVANFENGLDFGLHNV
jgi:hypothetical protein